MRMLLPEWIKRNRVSSLLHFNNIYVQQHLKTVRIYCDSCGAQNKNHSDGCYNIYYIQQYKDKDPLLQNVHPPCQHRVGRFVCLSVARTILARAKRNIFFKQNRKEQDKLLSFLMDVKLPKRSRPRGPERRCEGYNIVAINCLFAPSSSKDCSVLGKRRLDTIAEGIQTGAGVIDKRGGDRKTARFAKKLPKSWNLYLT
nr:unnamed protein product [Callosobruchus analis]